MSLIQRAQSTAPPWVELLVLEKGQQIEDVIPSVPEFAAKIIRGEKCRTKTGLFDEFAEALEFPAYFGRNWDAFDECITDLEWLPASGYVILIAEAQCLLTNDEKDYSTFIRVMQDAGKEWATPQLGDRPRPALPFHTFLCTPHDQAASRDDWLVPLLTS